jgi:hypothetical protein
MGFSDDLLKALDTSVQKKFGGLPSRLAKAANRGTSSVQKILKRQQIKWIESFGEIADAAGLKVFFEEDFRQQTTRPVTICGHMSRAVQDQVQIHESIDAAHVAAGPDSEDYIAVPLAESPVAAGPGLIPEDKIRGWVLVWKHQESVRWRSNLVAVEIGRGENSMVPTLHPGDIVLVDRNDKNLDPPGKIMLITEPGPDGGSAIKRVSTLRKDGDLELIFYSDNAREHPPRTYGLKRDYDTDITRAISGRVVWAWSDMTKK